MMVGADAVYVLPAQLVVLEWGAGNGSAFPAAGEAFDSGWFDTWRLHPEDVIQPKGGQIVSTADESIFGAGTHRRAGLYVLDLFVRQGNAAGDPLLINLDQIMAPALFSIGLAVFRPRDTIVVQSSLFGATLFRGRYLSKSYRIRQRMFRLSWTYPVSGAAEDWYLSAIVRSL